MNGPRKGHIAPENRAPKSRWGGIPGVIGSLLAACLAIPAGAAPEADAGPRTARTDPVPVAAWEAPLALDGIWKYRAGDSLQWARPDYDAAGWDSSVLMEATRRQLVPRQGHSWFRKEFTLPANPGPAKALAFRHMTGIPQEFYWDGVLVGRNGTLGNSLEEERLGEGFLKEIPASLATPGRHVLAVRLTAWHKFGIPGPAFMAVGDLAELELAALREALVMLFLAGIFVFAAIYRFLNYRASGYGWNTFLFSFFVIACSVYIVIEYLGLLMNLSDGAQLASRVILGIAWYFMVSMIPDYYVFAATFPYRWVGRAQLIAGIFFAVPMTLLFTGVLPFHYHARVQTANELFCYLSISISVWVIGWAVWRKQTGSRPALVGILCLLAGVMVTFTFDSNWAWAAGVAAHVIFLARAQSLQMSERLRIHRESEIRSARLEIELLKRNIQPHFLLNSLNSIIAWLEEEPKTAVHLVNALADELEILLKVSAEQTIPVEEEIRLCRTHLQVMGLRQDKSYRLASEGIRGGERIPPLVLHTLVENGLTHGYAGKTEGNFLLKREDIPGGMRFSLFNDGAPKEKREKKGEGTGLRYVRSRLEEAFPGRWSLDSRAVAGGWQVLLDVKHR